MDAPERPRQGRRAIAGERRARRSGHVAAVLSLGAALAAGSLASAGCASQPKRKPAPAEQAQAVAPQTVTLAPAPTPSTVESPVAAPVRSNEPVVIDEGGGSASGEKTLVAAAAAERERRRTAPPPTVVVNDKNLAQHATGKLTISQGSGATASAPAATAGSVPPKDEGYWRDRVRGLRERWSAAVDSIGELEAKAASLRTRFYAQDDPYVRDGEIKPAWDKALEDLDESRHRARSLEEQLAVALEEGRQAGALPGWLRDGIELEPSERPYDRPERHVLRDDANLVREPEELGQPPQR